MSLELQAFGKTWRAVGPRLTWSPFGIYDWLEPLGANGATGIITKLEQVNDIIQIKSYAGVFALSGDLASENPTAIFQWRCVVIHTPDYLKDQL